LSSGGNAFQRDEKLLGDDSVDRQLNFGHFVDQFRRVVNDKVVPVEFLVDVGVEGGAANDNVVAGRPNRHRRKVGQYFEQQSFRIRMLVLESNSQSLLNM